MPFHRPASLLLFSALALVAWPAAAQSPADSAPASAPDNNAASAVLKPSASAAKGAAPATAPKPSDDHGASPQAKPSDLNTALADSLPKYNPAKPEEKKPDDDSGPDRRDLDKPKNQIVRLPGVVVNAQQAPEVPNAAILAPQARADASMKRFVGVDPSKMSPVAAGVTRALFQAYADQQAADARREANLSDLKQTASTMSAAGDQSEGNFLQKAANDTSARPTDADWGAPVPGATPPTGK